MIVRDLLYNFGESIKKDVIDNHLKAGQRATGKSILAFEVEASDKGMIIYGPSYLEDLEKGVRPGTRPKVSDLEKWIVAKFNQPKFDVRNYATYLSQKIYKQGSLLYRQGGRKDIYSNVITDERIGKFTESLYGRFGGLIFEELVEAFNK